MTPNRKPRTLLNRWGSCFGHLWTVTVGVFALGMILHVTADVPPVEWPKPDAQTVQVVPSADDYRVLGLCWDGEAPESMQGKIPHRVIVADGPDAFRVGGDKLVGKALGQLFDGEDHGLTILAFCE